MKKTVLLPQSEFTAVAIIHTAKALAVFNNFIPTDRTDTDRLAIIVDFHLTGYTKMGVILFQMRHKGFQHTVHQGFHIGIAFLDILLNHPPFCGQIRLFDLLRQQVVKVLSQLSRDNVFPLHFHIPAFDQRLHDL